MANTVDIDEQNKVLTVSIDHDITVETTDELEQRLMRFLEDKFGFDLQLDLAQVKYMDSFGVGWLARLRQFMQARNNSVWLLNLTAPVRKTLQVTGFLPLFTRPGS